MSSSLSFLKFLLYIYIAVPIPATATPTAARGAAKVAAMPAALVPKADMPPAAAAEPDESDDIAETAPLIPFPEDKALNAPFANLTDVVTVLIVFPTPK